MKRYSLLRIVLLISLCSPVWAQSIFSQRLILDLSGKWDLVLDPNNRGIASGLCKEELGSTVLLPGTTDTNCKGIENTKTDETTHLSRKYRYAGPAWYSKEINLSPNWIGKQITLFFRTYPSLYGVD